MRLTIEVAKELLPNNKVAVSAFCKGAIARHEGKGMHENPYRGNTGFGSYFHSCWHRGWRLTDEGDCLVKEVEES